MTSEIVEIRQELNQLYCHRDIFLMYHKDVPLFICKTIKRLEELLRNKIANELLPLFPNTIDNYADDKLLIKIEYQYGKLTDIQILTDSYNTRNCAVDASENISQDEGIIQSDYNIIPTYGEIIRYICTNYEKAEISNLASSLGLTSMSNKVARQSAYKKIIKLLPYYLAINMNEGPKRIIPVRMHLLGSKMYKPIICKTVEEVIDLILHNTSGKNLRVYSDKVYDENDCIIVTT